jgi:hypothetical protein
VPVPSAFEVEMAIEKLKRHRSPGIDQIPEELIKMRKVVEFCYEIHRLNNAICYNGELPEQWRTTFLYLFIRRVIKQTVVIIEAYTFHELHTQFYQTQERDKCQALVNAVINVLVP